MVEVLSKDAEVEVAMTRSDVVGPIVAMLVDVTIEVSLVLVVVKSVVINVVVVLTGFVEVR